MPQGCKTVLPSQMKAFPIILKDACVGTSQGLVWHGDVRKPLCLKAAAVLTDCPVRTWSSVPIHRPRLKLSTSHCAAAASKTASLRAELKNAHVQCLGTQAVLVCTHFTLQPVALHHRKCVAAHPGSLPFRAPCLPAYDLLGCIPVFSGQTGARHQGARPLSDVARAIHYSILDTQLCSSSHGAMCRIFLGDVPAAANAMKNSSLPV